MDFSLNCFRFTVDSDPRWCCTYLLDATDPLFIEIGKSFIEQQIKGNSSLCICIIHCLNCSMEHDDILMRNLRIFYHEKRTYTLYEEIVHIAFAVSCTKAAIC